MKETLKSCRRVLLIRCLLTLVILISARAIVTQAQTPTPTPQDKRGIGLESNAAANTQTDQTKSKEAKPELVLQTGYNSFFGATRLIFSPDGRLLATATFRSSTVKLWETATGRELRDLSTGGQNSMSMSPVVAFSGDSRFLAAAAGNNSVKVWEVATGREVQTLSGPQTSVVSAFGVSFIAFSADGKTLVTVSDAIRVWDTASWRELYTVDTGSLNASSFTGGEGGLALSPDGGQLARVEADGSKNAGQALGFGYGARSPFSELTSRTN